MFLAIRDQGRQAAIHPRGPHPDQVNIKAPGVFLFPRSRTAIRVAMLVIQGPSLMQVMEFHLRLTLASAIRPRRSNGLLDFSKNKGNQSQRSGLLSVHLNLHNSRKLTVPCLDSFLSGDTSS